MMAAAGPPRHRSIYFFTHARGGWTGRLTRGAHPLPPAGSPAGQNGAEVAEKARRLARLGSRRDDKNHDSTQQDYLEHESKSNHNYLLHREQGRMPPWHSAVRVEPTFIASISKNGSQSDNQMSLCVPPIAILTPNP
jgi:hypothetical protein